MDQATTGDEAWETPAKSEPRWPASLAVLGSLGLYVVLPDRVITGLGPRWLVPALEAILGGALLLASPRRHSKESTYARSAAVVLIGLVNLANVVSLGELVHALLSAQSATDGRALVYASVPVWLTNVLVFALWYWEIDRGGPGLRLLAHQRKPDFLFPQMSVPGIADRAWSPGFFDYLYVSFTNATAFSPTDTMPLTARAKLLMMVQSFASLLIVALVVSRAVNILR